jgi:hypothetical protein
MHDLLRSKHNPRGGASVHFDNARLEPLIVAYNRSGDPAALAEIVELIRERALTLIRFNGTTKYRTESELLSEIHYKLVRSLRRFDAEKGSAFTFLSHLITNTLRTAVSTARARAEHYVELDEGVCRCMHTNGEKESREAIDGLHFRIRAGVKSTVSDLAEREAQRWYVASFLDGWFELRRFQCANSAMLVYGLSEARSRELYDLTVLEVRRILYADLKPRLIDPESLHGTRAARLLRYRAYLSREEFSKFVLLMKELAPYLVVLVDPENRRREERLREEEIRRNLGFVLNGHPEAVPLFYRTSSGWVAWPLRRRPPSSKGISKPYSPIICP